MANGRINDHVGSTLAHERGITATEGRVQEHLGELGRGPAFSHDTRNLAAYAADGGRHRDTTLTGGEKMPNATRWMAQR